MPVSLRFGDRNAHSFFALRLCTGTPVSKIEKKVKRRQQELRDEIERIKQRKEEREIEKEQMEEMKMQIAREMERDANADWDRKEEEFLREQVWSLGSSIDNVPDTLRASSATNCRRASHSGTAAETFGPAGTEFVCSGVGWEETYDTWTWPGRR